MSQYSGDDQHGYWWLHYNGQLRFANKCHNVEPEAFFKYAPCVKWWHVRCELDWYRMLKEYQEQRNGPLVPVIA